MRKRLGKVWLPQIHITYTQYVYSSATRSDPLQKKNIYAQCMVDRCILIPKICKQNQILLASELQVGDIQFGIL